jgi:AGCS family alanine or glycine:cation symporter
MHFNNRREGVMELIDKIIKVISDVLYQPWCVPAILLLGGVILTFATKFVQVRVLGECFKVLMEKPKDKNSISSFGALMISTASRVGTGNIIGVATAICAGGAGAVFWMWVTAIIGSALAFTESSLAQIYKKKNPDGSSYGGPAFYMQQALKSRWLGVIFSALIIFLLLLISDKIDSEDDIQRYLDLSVLATIPYASATAKRKTGNIKRKK